MNRGSVALHVKQDELIRVTEQARDALIGVEDLDQEDDEAIERSLEANGNGRDGRGVADVTRRTIDRRSV